MNKLFFSFFIFLLINKKMGNSNIKQTSSNVIGDGKFGGQVIAQGGVVAPSGAFDSVSAKTAEISGDITGQSANITGSGTFGDITGKTATISGAGTFGSISSDNSKFGNIVGTSLALQKGDITWGFNITDKDDLCITQNGNNLTCISTQGVLY